MLLAVIDTNVWISGLLNPNGPPARVAEHLWRQDFTPVLTPKLLAELEDVAQRPRLVTQFGLTAARLERLIGLLEQGSVFLPEPLPIAICRDPRDDMFIAAAVAAGADFLVSRDDDLKDDPVVSDYLADSGATVLTVRRFLEALAG